MQFQCNACGRTFIHPAKEVFPPTEPQPCPTYETSVCPICHSKEYTEKPVNVDNVQNVYVYELTSGPQTALDALLAQGYVIVNRYSKQYHLEKPKLEGAMQ